MYPSIGLFYPQLARAVLEYRVRTVDGAKDNAEKQGYKVQTSLSEATHSLFTVRPRGDLLAASFIFVCDFFIYF